MIVPYSSAYAKRQGAYRPSPKIYRPDAFHALWQDHANRTARGVGLDVNSTNGTGSEAEAEPAEETHAL
jgi:uncharacterized protein YfaP (DUF2135 family)